MFHHSGANDGVCRFEFGLENLRIRCGPNENEILFVSLSENISKLIIFTMCGGWKLGAAGVSAIRETYLLSGTKRDKDLRCL